MDIQLLKHIVSEFYALNAIPVFIMSKGKLIYHTVPDNYLSDRAEGFLSKFDKTGAATFGDIERYYSFSYDDRAENYIVIIGPCLAVHPMSAGYKGKLAIGNIIDGKRIQDFMITVNVTGEDNYMGYVSVISEMTGNGAIDGDTLPRRNVSFKAVMDKSLTEFVFDTRENMLSPYAPETEKRILDLVKAGDVEAVKKVNTAFTADAPGRSVGYLFKIVSLVAICTRAVLDSGVDATDAYGLSDRYLEKLGEATSDRQISDIAKNVLPHFASLVADKRGEGGGKYSPHLVKAEKYIKAHLHYRITLSDVAAEVGVSEKYLSRLFITHKGEKFTRYINRCRVNEAKELFLNTEYSLTDISYSLGFVSESYFIKVFKELCEMTPNNYRNRYKNNK